MKLEEIHSFYKYENEDEEGNEDVDEEVVKKIFDWNEQNKKNFRSKVCYKSKETKWLCFFTMRASVYT